MIITFRIIEPQDLPPDQKSHITFDRRGGKIGRSESANDWVLDNQYASKKHATIKYQDDGYYIKDHSSSGTEIQSFDQVEADYFHEEECKLNHGDIIFIGEYEIEVSIQDAEVTHPRTMGEEKRESIPEPESITRVPTNVPPRKPAVPPPEPEALPPEQPLTSSPPRGNIQALQAFLEGAGLENANISIDKLDPDLMRTLGQAFRVTVGGIIHLLEARKAFKIEADQEATRFAGGLNNPLKVIQDPSMVLAIMLSKNKQYFPMLESLEEALEDIEAHLLAMGEGARVSLDNTMKAVSPEEIERLVEQQLKGKWFNADGCKWKEFVKRYNDLEINKLLSEELAHAYEDQIDRLNKRR
jgi:predicted component of type VI protein secretion system